MRGATKLLWNPLLWFALVSLLAVLAPARTEPASNSLRSGSGLSKNDLAQSIKHGLSKRQADLEKIRERGAKMQCLMEATREAAKEQEGRDQESATFLKTDGIERLEGWDSAQENQDVSDQYSLRKAFDDLDISTEGQPLRLRSKTWSHNSEGIVAPDYENGIPKGMPKRGSISLIQVPLPSYLSKTPSVRILLCFET